MSSHGTEGIPELLARGQTIDALERVEAVRAAPESGAGWLADAVLSALLGEVERAWRSLLLAVQWSALSPSAAVAFASALDRPALARPLLVDLVARGERRDDPGGSLELARAELMLGDAEAAQRRARALADAHPALAAEATDLLERLGLFDVIAGLASDGVDALATRARVALWRGDAEVAARLAERAAADRADLHRILGAAAVLRGDPAGALPHLDRAIAAGDAEARRWRAEALRDRGELGLAFMALEEASREGTEAFALGVLRANVEAEMLMEAHAALPSGLAEALADRESLEQRYGVSFERGLPPWCGSEIDLLDPAERLAATRRVLDGLAGNRGDRLTRLEDGRLLRFEPDRSVRWRSDAALRALERDAPDRARDELDALVEACPRSPHPRCFRGELRLWRGEYDDALADFETALAIRPARWAHVGMGAVRLLRGDLDAAERAFAATEEFGPVPGATTHVYRGEGLRLAGRTDEALSELSVAVRGRPSRVGAWINLARLDVGAPDEAYARVRALAPGLLHLAARRIGRPVPRTPDPALLDACLAMLAGNRSSRIVTVFDGGRLRVLPPPDRIVAFGIDAILRPSSADGPESLRSAAEVARVLARAPRLPADLPVLDLRLLAVQRAADGIDLVIGRVAPLGLIRVRGPGRADALAPPGLEARLGGALSQLAARVGAATTGPRWEEASRAAEALPVCEAPI